MTNFYNFYPADGSTTLAEIPAAEVFAMAETSAAAPDNFGCYEMNMGLYVPTFSGEETQELVNEYRL